MSRRRRPRNQAPGIEKLQLVCRTSKHGPHRPYRIAKVSVWPNRDSGLPFIVRVHYVHTADEDRADRERLRNVPGSVHLTWPFQCGTCGRYVPIQEDKLIALVRTIAPMGGPPLDLGDLQRRMV